MEGVSRSNETAKFHRSFNRRSRSIVNRYFEFERVHADGIEKKGRQAGIWKFQAVWSLESCPGSNRREQGPDLIRVRNSYGCRVARANRP